jgi:hypothetical protein
MKTCNECRFALFEDYGYSNWTVLLSKEGTKFICLKSLHPSDGFDRWYGIDKRLEYADTCAGYTEGDPAEIDVDRELYPGTNYPEVEELVRNFYS